MSTNTSTELYTNEEIYGPMALSDEEFDAILEESLGPRASTMLYTKMGTLGLGASHTVLDIGCRDLRHGLQLIERYGCRVVGVDPLDYHIRLATEQIEEVGLPHQASAQLGSFEEIPAADSTFDFIFCRDMLTHVADLAAGFGECWRVLKPGGQMLIYFTSATDQLQPEEAAQIYPALGVQPASMETGKVEAAFTAAGFHQIEKDPIDSEWREFWEEDGTRITSHQLLRIARMRRNREAYIEKLGEVPYETELANCRWGVYQMLGKLCPMVYVIQKM